MTIADPRRLRSVSLAPAGPAREHTVSVVVDGAQIRGWTAYDITTSMIDPVDHFSLQIPFSREAWDRLRPDAPIKVMIDSVVVIDGFLDDREIPEGDDGEIHVSGRDRCGRLVQESAPGFHFAGSDALSLIRELAAPWFTRVVDTNTRNRRVLQGKGRKARAGREDVWIHTTKKASARIEPGQTRWQAIEEICHQMEILCWSAGDGRELILGRPNYEQEPIFRFFMPAEGSRRGRDANLLALGYKQSTGDRYSEIIVVGSGGGTDANYGTAVSSRSGRAVDNADFSAPKRLIIQKAIVSADDGRAWAVREMNRRNGQGTRASVRAARHGQVVSGPLPTIFAPDLMASIEDERTGIKGSFLIVGCQYRGDRKGAEETSLELVRKGEELSL